MLNVILINKYLISQKNLKNFKLRYNIRKTLRDVFDKYPQWFLIPYTIVFQGHTRHYL